jgi:hypothetical protein
MDPDHPPEVTDLRDLIRKYKKMEKDLIANIPK